MYYQDDCSLPIFASLQYGYPQDRIIDILLVSSVPLEQICKVQPLGVSQNAVFVVDIDVVEFRDLKADDLGLWRGTGTRKHISDYCQPVVLDMLNANMMLVKKYLLLTRRYYVHQSSAKYYRMIVDIQSKLICNFKCTRRTHTCTLCFELFGY